MALDKDKSGTVIKNKIKRYLYEIIIACTVILIHAILNSKLYPLTQTVGYDEQATLFWTGLLSSASWKEIIEVHNYYGFGFTFFLGILYYVFADPVVIYKITLFIISVFYAISAVVAFKLIQTIAQPQKREDIIFSLFVSIAVVFVPVKFVYVMNEHVFILINWLLIYCMIKMLEKDKNKFFYSVCIILLLGYSLTVHEKSITLWAGVVVSVLFFKIWFKETTMNLFLTGGSLLVIHQTTKKFIKWLRKFFWENAEKISSNSSSGTFATIIKKLGYLKNPYNWIFPIITFLSQLYFMTFCTGGIFLSVLLMSIYVFFKWGIQREGNITWKKQVVVIILYTLLCIFITIVVQDVTWMPDVSDYEATQVLQEIFGKRAKLYLRYFCCYCGPLIALFGVYCIKLYNRLKRFFTVSLGVYGLLSVMEIVCISPWYAENKLNGAPIYTMFLPFVLESPESFLSREIFVKAIIVSCLIVLLVYVLLCKRKFIFLGAFITFFFVYQYWYTGFSVYRINSETMYVENYPVYEVLKDIEEDDVDVVYMPEMSKKHIRLKYYLTNFSITKSSPTLSDEKIIIIHDDDNQVNSEYLKYNYKFIQAGAYEIYLSSDIKYNER